METVIVHPETAAVAAEVQPIIAKAQAFEVKNATDHAAALSEIKGIAAKQAAIQALFKQPKADAFAAHKSITAAEKTLLDPLAQARGIYTLKAGRYEDDAKRKAEEEARTLAAQAKQVEQEAQIQGAIAAEEAGDHEAADRILHAETTVPAMIPQPDVAKVAGVSSRDNWSAEVYDLPALLGHVLANPGLSHLIVPCMPELNKLAKAMKKGFNVPGVRAVNRPSMAVRTT